MKAWMLAAAAVIVVGGCKAKEEAPAPAASSSSAMQSSAMAPAANSMAAAKPMTMEELVGTWTDTMADGTKGTTTFASDGTYQDTDPKGKVEKGKYAIKNNKVCMTADGGKEQCWATSAPMADGTMTATSDDGQKITVKKNA